MPRSCASCVRSCRRGQRQALLERWDRVLTRALPDLQLAVDQRESALLALEAAAAEGAAWVALEDRMPLDQGAGVAPVLRPSVWTLDWEAPGGQDEDEDDGDHEDEMLVLKAADGRTEARFVLADRLVLAHLAADVRGLLAEGQSLPPIPDAEPPTSLPTLRVDAEAASPARGSPFVGYRPLGSRSRGTTHHWPS